MLPLPGREATIARRRRLPAAVCAHAAASRPRPGELREAALTSAAFLFGASCHAAAFFLLLLQACLGSQLIRLARMDEALSKREQLLLGWAAGFATTTILLGTLVALQALDPQTVLLSALAVTVFAAPELHRFGRRSLAQLRTADRGLLLTLAVGALGLAVFAWPMWVASLLPNSDWDSALYHLPMAERFRAGGLLSEDPYFSAFSFPGAVHLHYAALIESGLEAVITPLNFQVQLLTGLAAMALARTVGGRRAALWTAVAYAATPILWQLGLDARIDGFLAFSITLAVYGLVRFAQQGRDPQAALSALALGAAIGCKYTAWLFVPPVLAIGLGLRLWGARGTKGLGRLIAVVTVAIAVPNAGWYVANFALHGDPLFPILRGDYIVKQGSRVRLPRADEPLPAAELQDPSLVSRIEGLGEAPENLGPTHLLDLLDLLREPERYAVRPNHGMGALLLLSLLLPLRLPGRPERRRGAILVWSLGWGSFAVLGTQIPLLRYAAPALPLLAVATGALVARLPFRAFRVAFGVAALALLVRDHQAEQRKLELLQVPHALAGEESPWRSTSARREWTSRVGFNFTPPMAIVSQEMVDRMERNEIPRDCVLFMIGEGKGRLQPCAYLPDGSWFGHRFLGMLENAERDPAKLARSLRALGVTHVLYNRAYYDWVAESTDTSRDRIAFLELHVERFLAQQARPLFTRGGIHLYELEPERRVRRP